MSGKSRGAIVDALVEKLKDIDATNDGVTSWDINLSNNVTNKLVFWDEVNDFPFVSVVAGSESREYHPGDFKWGYLNIIIRIYVMNENPVTELEGVMTNIETLLDLNNELVYDGSKRTEQISLLSINTDEGLLAPYGVGEMTIEVRYQVTNS